jgi:hypothetical protein
MTLWVYLVFENHVLPRIAGSSMGVVRVRRLYEPEAITPILQYSRKLLIPLEAGLPKAF